jgi:hypothetical protein
MGKQGREKGGVGRERRGSEGEGEKGREYDPPTFKKVAPPMYSLGTVTAVSKLKIQVHNC